MRCTVVQFNLNQHFRPAYFTGLFTLSNICPDTANTIQFRFLYYIEERTIKLKLNLSISVLQFSLL